MADEALLGCGQCFETFEDLIVSTATTISCHHCDQRMSVADAQSWGARLCQADAVIRSALLQEGRTREEVSRALKRLEMDDSAVQAVLASRCSRLPFVRVKCADACEPIRTSAECDLCGAAVTAGSPSLRVRWETPPRTAGVSPLSAATLLVGVVVTERQYLQMEGLYCLCPGCMNLIPRRVTPVALVKASLAAVGGATGLYFLDKYTTTASPWMLWSTTIGCGLLAFLMVMVQSMSSRYDGYPVTDGFKVMGLDMVSLP